MNALIIGGAGFVGRYLADHLRNNCGYSVFLTKMKHEEYSHNGVTVIDMDLLDMSSIANALGLSRPDVIFHLAAQSSVALSWSNPQLTVDVNVKGTVNVLEAVRSCGIKPKILVIGSGEEYGYIDINNVPINENTALKPGNIYAATKACQEMIGVIYSKAYSMDIVMTRSFNHCGPGQLPQFVISDFCKQVAEIEKCMREPLIKVGNLSVKRDFLDVRDVVVAYSLLAAQGISGEAYNVGSGSAIEIKQILARILSMSEKKITVEQDLLKMRPSDIPIIEADTNKLQAATGWVPTIPFETTLADTLNYWRGTTII